MFLNMGLLKKFVLGSCFLCPALVFAWATDSSSVPPVHASTPQDTTPRTFILSSNSVPAGKDCYAGNPQKRVGSAAADPTDCTVDVTPAAHCPAGYGPVVYLEPLAAVGVPDMCSPSNSNIQTQTTPITCNGAGYQLHLFNAFYFVGAKESTFTFSDPTLAAKNQSQCGPYAFSPVAFNYVVYCEPGKPPASGC